MNEEDQRLQVDERDAEPERFPSGPAAMEEIEPTLTATEKEERREKLSRQVTASTPSQSSRSSIESVERQQIGVSRMTTRHESVDLERHPTALSRIATGRSQQSHTVGSSLRSRTATRQSKKPLPNFGGGKPFPPPLPEREEYVVEFDGPNDPCKFNLIVIDLEKEVSYNPTNGQLRSYLCINH